MAKMQLLIADDNPLSLRFLSEAAGSCGFTCRTAADGSAALEASNRQAFALLLLDAHMPGIGGIELLREIRAGDGPSRLAPAIATTADDRPQTRRALLHAGFEAVLLKPLSTAVLARTLEPYGPMCKASSKSFDPDAALAATGGDPELVEALRELLIAELEALPGELAALAANANCTGLRERLHRLDASAGFCGVPGLTDAVAELRRATQAPGWPRQASARFLHHCAELLSALRTRAPG